MFKGCHSYGKTVEEALKNIKEVIEICLDEINEEDKNQRITCKIKNLKKEKPILSLYMVMRIYKGLLRKIIREDLEMSLDEFLKLYNKSKNKAS